MFSSFYEYLVGKSLKALNMLLFNCKMLPLKLRTLCQLFDSFVGAILNCSSEICGFSKSKELERLHLKFCKRILKVTLSSSNSAIYGELERFPLYMSRYRKIIKYWCKIVQSENIILNRLYTLVVKDCLSGYTNWVS